MLTAKTTVGGVLADPIVPVQMIPKHRVSFRKDPL